jgi:predicted TIM-barrel fold metal-dependent hydrolase
MPDDPRLDQVWSKAGELNIPVTIHIADPVAFFLPLDETNERWEELYEHPDWHFYGRDIPPFINLINRFLRIVERHPKTTFIGAHIMGYSENLGFVSQALDKYPNLYVDITERISELGRQPYSSRKFMMKYSDRVVFGTDTLSPKIKHYQTNFRFLETEDEYFEYGRNQGRWYIYGIHLPDDVLRKIYFENAMRIIPGTHV